MDQLSFRGMGWDGMRVRQEEREDTNGTETNKREDKRKKRGESCHFFIWFYGYFFVL